MDIQTAFNSLLPNVLKYINITNMHILILNEDFQKNGMTFHLLIPIFTFL